MGRVLIRLLLSVSIALATLCCTHHAGVLRRYEATVPVTGTAQVPPGTPIGLEVKFESAREGWLRGTAAASAPGSQEFDIQQHEVEAVNQYEFFGATLWRAFAAPVHLAVLAPLWHWEIRDYGGDGNVGAGDRLLSTLHVLNPLMAWPIEAPVAGDDVVTTTRRERRPTTIALPFDLELVLTSPRGSLSLTAPVDANGKFAIALFPSVEKVWDSAMQAELRDRRNGGAAPVPRLAEEMASFLATSGRLAQVEWDAACALDTKAAYERFRARFPEARWSTAIRDRLLDRDWRDALAQGDRPALSAFLRNWPESSHATEANVRLEELDWQDAARIDTAQAYELFLAAHPQGTRGDAATKRRDQLRLDESWRRAERIDTAAAYREFVAAHPDDQRARTARERIEALTQQADGWLATCRIGTEKAFRDYLAGNGGSAYARAAERALLDLAGRDIVDLIDEGKVEVRSAGHDIQQIRLELRRVCPYPVRARLPAGSYFVAGRSTAQNMVATSDVTVDLGDDQWLEVDVRAACANKPKDIPGPDDTFTIERPEHEAELARLLPTLARASADTAIRQAAVWIVTDDADYHGLGTLVQRRADDPFGGTRVIGPSEAVRALQICGEAGIAIASKRLLEDRDELLRQLPEGELKTWFAGLAPAPRKQTTPR